MHASTLTFLPASARYHLLSLEGLGLPFFCEQYRGDYWRERAVLLSCKPVLHGVEVCSSL